MKSIITSITLLFITIVSYGQKTDFAKLDSFFMTLENNDRFFGSVAVSRAGEILYTKAIGYADIEKNIPNNNETKFRIGSISKTFTAALIMQAVEEGKVKLEDTIDKYFPKVQNADRITVRHLLNHRSGIVNFTDSDYLSWHTTPISPTNLLDSIIYRGVDFEPDAAYAYSNSNYVLLTFILETSLEKPFAKILEDNIVKPLGLTHTSYGAAIQTDQNEAKSYNRKTDWIEESQTDMSIPLGAGGIISTPIDLCRFATALYSGKVVSKESLDKMKPIEGEEYGFALYNMYINEWSGLGHGGAIDEFTSTFTYFEDEDISYALSCNGSNFGNRDIAIAVLSELFGKPYKLPTFDFVELSSEELDQYVGTYETEDLPIDLIVSKKGNTLFLQATGQSAGPILAEGNHKFSKMQYGVKIEFVPAEKKMLFEQNGMAFEFFQKQTKESNVDTDLDQYLGTYESDLLPMDLKISIKDGALIGQGTGQPSFSLEEEGEHVFSNKEIGLEITFDPKGKKMQFEQGGAEFEMTLEK